MKQAANVTSIEAIRRFQRDLKRYEIAMRGILESFVSEASRAEDWIEHDRTRYWPHERLKAEDRVVEARNQLQRAQMAALKDQHKSCIDEKKLVERALARLRLCEEKIAVVRGWRHKMRSQSEQFSGKLARMTNYLDTDIPRALAALDRMIRALEKYAEPGQATERKTRSSLEDSGGGSAKLENETSEDAS